MKMIRCERSEGGIRRGLVLGLFSLLLLLTMLAGPSAHATEVFLKTIEASPLTESELARLRNGEILVSEQSKEQGGKMRYVLAKVMIDRSPDKVWKALLNQESLFQGEPHMKQVKIVKAVPPNVQNISYKLSISKLLPTFEYVTKVEFVQPRWTAKFVRISGSFKAFKGFAKLKPYNSGKQTVMVYALQLDTGFLLPQFVVRSVLKGGLPDLMKHVRKRVHTQNPCIGGVLDNSCPVPKR